MDLGGIGARLAAAGGAQDAARLAVACGRGARSSLPLLRRGVGVAEVAASPRPMLMSITLSASAAALKSRDGCSR